MKMRYPVWLYGVRLASENHKLCKEGQFVIYFLYCFFFYHLQFCQHHYIFLFSIYFFFLFFAQFQFFDLVSLFPHMTSTCSFIFSSFIFLNKIAQEMQVFIVGFYDKQGFKNRHPEYKCHYETFSRSIKLLPDSVPISNYLSGEKTS